MSSVKEKMTALADAVRAKAELTDALTIDGMTDAVNGLLVGEGTDTSDATANSGDILSGKTAYISGGKVTGTMTDVGALKVEMTPENDYYYNAGGYVSILQVYAHSETKTFTPSSERQTYSAADKFVGEVIINPIPSNCIATDDATASSSDIFEGKTAYVKGEKVTGTVVDRGGASIVMSPAESIRELPAGFYSGVDIQAPNESITFTPSKETQSFYGYNEGKFLSNVTVNPIPAEYSLTGDATVASDTLLSGVTAYGANGKVTGSVPTVTASVEKNVVTLPSGYIAQEQVIAVGSAVEGGTITPGVEDIVIHADSYLLEDIVISGAPALDPENIKTGVSIFGVEGTFTADADAEAKDIASGKTAYVNGEKITGTASGGNVVRHWMIGSDNNRYLESCIFDAQTAAVPVNGSRHNFLCADGKIVYRPQNRIADTSIKWKYAVSDSMDYFAIAISDDGKLYNVDYYVTNADGKLKATRLCPDVEGFTQTTGRVLGDKTLAIANGDLYLTNSGLSGYYKRVQYKREKETDPVVYVEAANLLNCQQSSYDYAYVITYDGDLARVWCTGDSDVGDAYAEIYSSDRANGNPFLNYHPVSSDYEDYNSRTYEFAFREDGLWFRRPGTVYTDGVSDTMTWEKADDPGLIKTNLLGYCTSYAEEHSEYNEETGEEVWNYKFRETTVALHIDTQGRLWKLAACGTGGSEYTFTGLSVTQVGADDDWEGVPPSINIGQSNVFAQKGGKLIKLTPFLDTDGKITLTWTEFLFSPLGHLIANTNNYDLFFAPSDVTVDLSKPGGTF